VLTKNITNEKYYLMNFSLIACSRWDRWCSTCSQFTSILSVKHKSFQHVT